MDKLNRHKPIQFSGGMVIMMYVLLGASLFLPNGVYMLAGLLALTALIKFIWKIHTPGIFIFSYFLQWLQVFSFILWMNLLNKDLDGMTPNGGNAFFLSIVGLAVMAATSNLMIGKLKVYDNTDFKISAQAINQRKLLILYVISTAFLSGIGFILGATSGFAQILVTISSLKWVFLLWLGFVIWVQNTHRWWLILIVLYEFTVGLYSYFSSFKEVIFFVIILSFTFIKLIEFKQFIRLLFIGLSLMLLLLTWSAIKGEYRNYLNQGSRQQVVSVSREDALGKIGEQVTNLDYEKYQKALTYTAYRLQYVYHFALSMDKVPDDIPFQNGKIWGENISYVLTPRILNPNKKLYNASEKASKFTGKKFAGLKEGSSFSLGYFADAFVDFGPIGMFIVLIGMSLFTGFIYKTFYNMVSLNLFLRFGLVNVALFNFASFESDGLYMFGRLLTDFIVFYFLARFVFPSIQKWVYD